MVDDGYRPSRLGRGLAALIGDVGEPATADRARGQRALPIEFIRGNPLNPRKTFLEEDLDELAASIREKGIIQPIVVRPVAGEADTYEIIAGERRWRAAQRAGLHDVPAVVLEVNDREALELAIIENVQRTDLNALEEAAGYEQLIAQFGYAQAELGKVVGKSRSHVANTMRLAKLPASVKARVMSGQLSAGHARALLAVSDPEATARRIVDQGLTVREVERLAQMEAGAAPERKAQRARPGKDADTLDLEKALSDGLGLAVAIDHRGQSGTLSIRYATLEQLDALCRRLKA